MSAMFVKANQHATVIRQFAHGKSRPMPVAPGRPLRWRQYLLWPNPADVPQTIFQYALLGGHLRRRVHMLHGAATAHAEILAARCQAGAGWFKHAHQMRQLVTRFTPKAGVFNGFTRQGAVNENCFALQASNASRLMIQRFDDPDCHGQLRKSANFNNPLTMSGGIFRPVNRTPCRAS
jgi:hypothetical protein